MSVLEQWDFEADDPALVVGRVGWPLLVWLRTPNIFVFVDHESDPNISAFVDHDPARIMC